ncbi:hypothetical protein F1880_010152 [Penicillium rolfsii]|nr:hypothetical protein F1880_010152 [Penicillium rolfsii]
MHKVDRSIYGQVFYEEDFRQRYEQCMSSSYVSSLEDNNDLWITLLVIGLGAHYSSLAVREPLGKSHMQQLAGDIIMLVEQRFLRIMSSADEEAVQVCILLGSFYLFNGRPTAGLGILGSGIKIAQVLRLHREGALTEISAARLETRRRSWLALEVFDKYAAIAFGRPCTVDDSDCDVDTVSDVKTDTDDRPRQASQLDYHRLKFRLYRIVGPFLARRQHKTRPESVQSIHAQLVSWQIHLPDNLRLERYKDKDNDKGTPQVPSLLQMQALALQLTYDNIQIILHRSLAFGSGSQISAPDRSPDDLPRSALSRKQLFESALRTSQLNDYSHVLHACGKTHAAMHVGICLFTAGVVLCAFAISDPLSATSEAAKNGVMNILRFQHDPILNEHLLSAQSVRILEDLVTVLLRSEHRVIRGVDPILSQPSGKTTGEEEIPTCRQKTDIHESNADSRLDNAKSMGLPRESSSFQGHYLFDNSLHVLALLISLAVDIEPSTTIPREIRDGILDGTNLSIGPESDLLSMDSTAGVMWTGGNPYFVDPSFADASQLWLWSNNPDVQPFLE